MTYYLIIGLELDEEGFDNMSKKVLIISSSLRSNSNSDKMAEEAFRGAKVAGHDVNIISLKNKDLRFCKGCLACQKTRQCVILDDMDRMIEQVKEADVLIFVSPIYYNGMSGQLKTFLDRCNPLYVQDYKFREVYLLTTSAEEGEDVYQRAASGINGWVKCFKEAKFKGVFNGGGVNAPGEIKSQADILKRAYAIGHNI